MDVRTAAIERHNQLAADDRPKKAAATSQAGRRQGRSYADAVRSSGASRSSDSEHDEPSDASAAAEDHSAFLERLCNATDDDVGSLLLEYKNKKRQSADATAAPSKANEHSLLWKAQRLKKDIASTESKVSGLEEQLEKTTEALTTARAKLESLRTESSRVTEERRIAALAPPASQGADEAPAASLVASLFGGPALVDALAGADKQANEALQSALKAVAAAFKAIVPVPPPAPEPVSGADAAHMHVDSGAASSSTNDGSTGVTISSPEHAVEFMRSMGLAVDASSGDAADQQLPLTEKRVAELFSQRLAKQRRTP